MLNRKTRQWILATAVIVLLPAAFAGCGGSGSSSAMLAPAGSNAADVSEDASTGLAQFELSNLVGLPQDAYVDPAIIAARRGSELVEREQSAAAYYAKSANAELSGDLLILDPTDPQSGSWAVYQFDNLLDADYPFHVSTAFHGEAYLPESCFIGISHYGRDAWSWHEFDTPEELNSVYLQSEDMAISPGGNLYIAVVVLGATVTRLESVTLELDTDEPPPPVWDDVSQGTAAEEIMLSWVDPAVSYPGLVYDEVRVERSLARTGPWEQVAGVPAGTVQYADINGPERGRKSYYRLRTVAAGLPGWSGPVDYGWRAVEDVDFLSATDGEWDWITVAWSPVLWADGYRVEYVDAGGEYPALWTTLTTLPSNELTQVKHSAELPVAHEAVEGKTYKYRVKATVEHTLSPDWSPVDTGSFIQGYVETLTVTGNPVAVVLDWSSVPQAQGYLIEYRPNGEPEGWTELETTGGVATIFEHTADTPAEHGSEYHVLYDYRVKPVGLARSGRFWSPVHSGRREVGYVEGAWTYSACDQIAVFWEMTPEVEGYQLEYRNDDGGDPVEWNELITAPLSSFNIYSNAIGFAHKWNEPVGREARPATAYFYRIKAYTGEEYSADWSEAVSGSRAQVKDITNFTASECHADRVEFDYYNHNSATGILIEYRNLDGGDPVDWELLQLTGDDHTAESPVGKECVLDTAYEYRIKGTAGDAQSENWVVDTGGRSLFDVFNFSATDGWYDDHIDLSWDEMLGVDGYHIEYRDAAGVTPADWTQLAVPDGSSSVTFSHTTASPVGLEAQPGMFYDYRIVARLGAGQSSGWASDAGHCGFTPPIWRMYGGEARRTWRSDRPGPENPEVKWFLSGVRQTPVVGGDGGLFVPDGSLKVLNSDGSERWTTGSSVDSAALLDGQTVIAAGLDTSAYQVSGELRWRTGDDSYDLIIGSDDTLYTTVSNRLYAHNDDGLPLWFYDTGEFWTSPVAEGLDGNIYISAASELLALDNQGALQWAYETGGNRAFEPSVGDDGTIFLLSYGSPVTTLHAVNPDGTGRWTYDYTAGHYSSTPVAVASDGTAYVRIANYLYAMTPAGTVDWECFITGLGPGYMVIDPAGTIYMNTLHCDLYAVNPDGTIKWSYSLSDEQYSSSFQLIIGGDGIIFAVNFDAEGAMGLFAIGEAD